MGRLYAVSYLCVCVAVALLLVGTLALPQQAVRADDGGGVQPLNLVNCTSPICITCDHL